MPYIHIDRETSNFMTQYARSTGQSQESAIKAALKEWIDVLGEPVLLCASPKKVAKKVAKIATAISPQATSAKTIRINKSKPTETATSLSSAYLASVDPSIDRALSLTTAAV